jgi:hypothetical protein
LELAAGRETTLDLGESRHGVTVQWRTPDGRKTPLTADESGRVEVNPVAPGIHVLTDAAGVELRRFAVNVPAGESDLAAWRPNEWQQLIVRTGAPGERPMNAGWLGIGRNRQEFWRVLLLAAVILLLLESILANRSYA